MTTKYDQVPYESEPVRVTYPDHLSTIAWLLGVDSASPDQCRVLELGCGNGINLASMASILPKSRFVGIDLAEQEVRSGNDLVKRLSLDNVSLTCGRIEDLSPALGEFDYILCHGILSWVPATTQERIFEIFNRHLSARGLAYVSYNTFPGWHARMVIREMMLRGVRSDAPMGQVAEARSTGALLDQMLALQSGPYAELMRGELRQMMAMPNWYFVHDFLAPENHPFYFRDLVLAAEKLGLQYVADAELSSMSPERVPSAVRAVLNRAKLAPLEIEHFSDLARNRMFRRSIFCRQGTWRPGDWNLERLESLRFASALQRDKADREGTLVRFVHRSGGQIHTPDPLLVRVVDALAESWPQSLGWDDIVKRLGPQANPDAIRGLKSQLLSCWLAELIELRRLPDRFTPVATEFPCVSPLARFQASQLPPYIERAPVTNLRHETVVLEALPRKLIRYLDGRTSRAALIDKLRPLVSGVVEPSPGELDIALQRVLQHVGENALLVGRPINSFT